MICCFFAFQGSRVRAFEGPVPVWYLFRTAGFGVLGWNLMEGGVCWSSEPCRVRLVREAMNRDLKEIRGIDTLFDLELDILRSARVGTGVFTLRSTYNPTVATWLSQS
jgi:hypothetical protein